MHWYAGASCRLYPAAEADTAAEATVAGEEAETAEPETAENADESEGEEIQELQSTKGWTKLWDLKMFFSFYFMVKYRNLTQTSCEILQLFV